MIETSANNNYIVNQNSPGGVAASTAGVYIEDDVDGAEFDDIRAEQDIALNSGRNSIVNATTSAVEEQEQREERDEGQMEENEEEENLPQRNRALSASFPGIAYVIPHAVTSHWSINNNHCCSYNHQLRRRHKHHHHRHRRRRIRRCRRHHHYYHQKQQQHSNNTATTQQQ